MPTARQSELEASVLAVHSSFPVQERKRVCAETSVDNDVSKPVLDGGARGRGPEAADLFDALDQGHQGGWLHSLGRLINDHHIKLVCHLEEYAGA